MPTYLISFPASAMAMTEDRIARADDASHDVVREAREAGAWVFGGAIDQESPPILVEADGAITRGTYPETSGLDGGFALLRLPSFDDAVRWAAKLAEACGCAQELRVFSFDPES